MKKKTRLDFNHLYDLYKQESLEQARVLLYENMDRFLTDTRINLHYSLIYGYDDIKQDMYLLIDEWILKSISKGFVAKQAFNYIKCRVKNTIKNILNPTRGSNNIKYFDDYGLNNPLFEPIGEDDIESVEYKSCLDEAIIGLSDLHRKIILLKYYSSEDTSLNDISKYIGKNLYETVLEHAQALHEIREQTGVVLDEVEGII